MIDPLTFLIWGCVVLLFAPLLLAITVIIAGFTLTIMAITFVFLILILGVVAAPSGYLMMRWFNWSFLARVAQLRQSIKNGKEHS